MGNIWSKSSPRTSHPPKKPTFDILKIDAVDYERIQWEQRLFKAFWYKNFSAPVHNLLNSNGTKVLEVGPGSGIWAADMATDFPLTHFTCFDRPSNSACPVNTRNVEFVRWDTKDGGLPFDSNTFDYCYARSAYLWMNLCKKKMAHGEYGINELVRVCKPGGWIELLEFKFQIYDAGPRSSEIMKKLRLTVGSYTDLDISDKVEELLHDTGRLTPIRYYDKVMPLYFKDGKIAELAAQYLLPTIIKMSGLSQELSPEEFKETHKLLYYECNQYESYMKHNIFLAQKIR
ncbi:10033_t:CDS:2 [Ambispora gerdemannii]|uniref:10033_t:CDS:1 n=1 Tax=Ambispora gerdemannii TaxID=144530 RepID=A0A9N9FVC6_9GLOM|nr:10033_t:CDS:2 [Ambispora gerdemannii]